jgi:hypothetical protein
MLDAPRAVCVSTGLTRDLRAEVHKSWQLNCKCWRLIYFGSAVRYLLHVTFLAPRILRWQLDSRKICAQLRCSQNGRLLGTLRCMAYVVLSAASYNNEFLLARECVRGCASTVAQALHGHHHTQPTASGKPVHTTFSGATCDPTATSCCDSRFESTGKNRRVNT